jgi:hypothetical protein
MSIGVEPLTLSKTLQVSNVIRAQNSPNRISLPVNRQQYLYARFKHIWGFPETRRGEGYSLAKLRALDTLLDRLQRLKGKSAEFMKASVPGKFEQLSPEQIDKMVQQYQQEIHNLVSANGQPYKGVFIDTGLLLNILA